MFKMMHDEIALLHLMATGTPMRWIKVNERLWLIELRRGWALVGVDTYDALSVLSFARVVITDELEAVRLFVKNHWLITNAYAPYLPGGGALQGANWKKIEQEIKQFYDERLPVPGEALVNNARLGYWMLNGSAREFLVSSALVVLKSALLGGLQSFEELVRTYCLFSSGERDLARELYLKLTGMAERMALSEFEKRVIEAYKRLRARTVGRYEKVIEDKLTEFLLAKVLVQAMRMPVLDNAGVFITPFGREAFPVEYAGLECERTVLVKTGEPVHSWILRYFEGISRPLHAPDNDMFPEAPCPAKFVFVPEKVCVAEASHVLLEKVLDS